MFSAESVMEQNQMPPPKAPSSSIRSPPSAQIIGDQIVIGSTASAADIHRLLMQRYQDEEADANPCKCKKSKCLKL